ncbi:MAG: carboxypeptidase-like regulatory domain-containing protein, partial [Candidatus Acidiferrales bacterium]
MNRGIRSRNFLVSVLSLASLLAICVLPAFGQIDRGAIVGRVLDASGAVIPRATVTITNKATGVASTTSVDDTGEYQVLALIPGTYTVQVSASGFETTVQDNVAVHVQDRLSIGFVLKVGSVSQEVHVTGGEPILQTQTGDLGHVVDQQQVVDLPLNGRRYA